MNSVAKKDNAMILALVTIRNGKKITKSFRSQASRNAYVCALPDGAHVEFLGAL